MGGGGGLGVWIGEGGVSWGCGIFYGFVLECGGWVGGGGWVCCWEGYGWVFEVGGWEIGRVDGGVWMGEDVEGE